MYKKNLALDKLPWLICHKTKSNQTMPNLKITFQLTMKISLEQSRKLPFSPD